MSTGNISAAGEGTRVRGAENNSAVDEAGQDGMASRFEAMERQLTMITEKLALLNVCKGTGNEIAAQAGSEPDTETPQTRTSHVKTKKGKDPDSDDSSSESCR
jgi:hypothetical protein